VALRVALGELASDILGSQRALPTVLEASGFTFSDPLLDDAARRVAERR
jgi:NAD dependent epimerase/dehydratase family enzyme